MFHAARLSAPSGGGPMARETEHCGQKQMRCADDFCRGLIPTVCANMYTATDLWPTSISRLQRRQNKFSKASLPGGTLSARTKIVSLSLFRCKYAEGFPESGRSYSGMPTTRVRLFGNSLSGISAANCRSEPCCWIRSRAASLKK